jgi:hypothetical protein
VIVAGTGGVEGGLFDLSALCLNKVDLWCRDGDANGNVLDSMVSCWQQC